MKYRKKPVEIEAIRWTGDNLTEVMAFCPKIHPDDMTSLLVIETLEGKLYAQEEDYIIKGFDGEFYPCNPSVFLAAYDEVDAE